MPETVSPGTGRCGRCGRPGPCSRCRARPAGARRRPQLVRAGCVGVMLRPRYLPPGPRSRASLAACRRGRSSAHRDGPAMTSEADGPCLPCRDERVHRCTAQRRAGRCRDDDGRAARTRPHHLGAGACRGLAGARVLAENGVRPGDAVAVLAAQAVRGGAGRPGGLAGRGVGHDAAPADRADEPGDLRGRDRGGARADRRQGGRAGRSVHRVRRDAGRLRRPGLHRRQLVGEPGGPAPGGVEIGEDGPALLQLTSGSTSTPKAVQITHRNLWANIEVDVRERRASIPAR